MGKKIHSGCPFRAGTKEYHRWYDINVRGRSRKAGKFIRVRCLICGSLIYPVVLDRKHRLEALLQEGYSRYFKLDDPALVAVRAMLEDNRTDKYKKMARKCMRELDGFVKQGLITFAEIEEYFSLKTAGVVESPGVIESMDSLVSPEKFESVGILEDVETHGGVLHG